MNLVLVSLELQFKMARLMQIMQQQELDEIGCLLSKIQNTCICCYSIFPPNFLNEMSDFKDLGIIRNRGSYGLIMPQLDLGQIH